MRFVPTALLAIGMALITAQSGAAKPWAPVPLNPAKSKAAPYDVKVAKGAARADSLATLSALELTPFAKSLGEISALALGEAGTLYAADKESGRIWELKDRGADGTLDQRRPLPARFDGLTGLAVIGETLYIADRQAIWALEGGAAAPRQIAGLSHVQSSGNHPLLADGENLLLAVSTDTDAKLISVNRETGFASLMHELSAPIYSLSKREGSEVWAGTDSGLIKASADGEPLQFGQSARIEGLLLPGQYGVPDDWPASLKGHILAAQTGAGAMRLLAIPTEFGQPQGPARVLVDGFLSGSQRSAWGAPGAMLSDARGLFFADPHNGTLWRLAPKPKAPIKITIVDTKDLGLPETKPPAPPSSQSSLLKGSGIVGSRLGAASQLGTASQLTVGSTIIEAYDKAKAQEEEEKAAAKAAKEKLSLPPDISFKPELD